MRFVVLLLGFSLHFCSFGAIRLVFDVDQLKTAEGAPMPESGLVLLAASTLDSAFSEPTPNSFFSSLDDIIVGRWSLDSGFGPGVFTRDFTTTLSGDWNTGDPLQLYWYPTLTEAATQPGAGTTFGRYTDPVGIDGSDPWFTPSDGNAQNTLRFVTTDALVATPGSNPPEAGEANFTVVPEPSDYAAIIGLACLGWAVISRKVKAAGTTV
jgi:hypothetical protein